MDKRAFDLHVNRILKQISEKPLEANLFEYENVPIHFIMRTSDERANIRKILEVCTIYLFFFCVYNTSTIYFPAYKPFELAFV